MSLYIEEEGSVTLPFDTEEIAIAVRSEERRVGKEC